MGGFYGPNAERHDRQLHDYIRRQLDKHAIRDIEWTPRWLIRKTLEFTWNSFKWTFWKAPWKCIPYIAVYSPIANLATLIPIPDGWIQHVITAWNNYVVSTIDGLMTAVGLTNWKSYFGWGWTKYLTYFPCAGNCNWFNKLSKYDSTDPTKSGPLGTLLGTNIQTMDVGFDASLTSLGVVGSGFILMNILLNLLLVFIGYKIIM